jgi:uncharacterized protein involved in oxidation of intracellular sulfur
MGGETLGGCAVGTLVGWELVQVDTKRKEVFMKTLFILNDAPYGTERSYNGLRLAGALSKREGQEVKIFLIGDAVACAKKGQRVPQGYYNSEVMLKSVLNHKSDVGICGTCMDARGITDPELLDGTKRSTMEQLTDWTIWAEKIQVW